MQQLDNLFGFGARFSWQDSHAWVVSLHTLKVTLTASWRVGTDVKLV